MRAYACAFGLIALTGCSSTPVTVVEKVQIPTYIPVPATLTAPIAIDLTGDTWGKAVGDLKAGLQICDGQLESIKTLKVPPKTP